MKVRKRYLLMFIAAFLLLIASASCAPSVKLTHYTDALAASIFTGSSEDLSKYEKKAVTDVSEQKNAVIEDISLHFLTYIGLDEPDTESVTSMKQWVSKALTYVRLEPCTAGDDGTVTLIIHPVDVIKIFGEKFESYYESFSVKNDNSYYKDITDISFQNTYMKGVMKILNKSLLAADATNTVRLNISLTTNDKGLYMLEDGTIEDMLTSAFAGYDIILDEPWPKMARRTHDGFDVYVQALMDCMYLCDPTSYSEITGYDTDDCYDIYWDGLYAEANAFLEYLGVDAVSEDLMDEIAYMLSYAYDYSNYSVTEGSNGAVDVTIYPMNIYIDSYTDVRAFVDEFNERNENYEFSDYTDDEYMNAYVMPIIDIFYDYIYDMSYADPVTVTVHVDIDDDGNMSISEDDFNLIDYYIINYDFDTVPEEPDVPKETGDPEDTDKPEDADEPKDAGDQGATTFDFDSFFHKPAETVDFGDDVA